MFLYSLFFIYPFPFSAGNLSSLMVPAAVVGAAGYGYMRFKVWNFLDPCCFCNRFISLWLTVYFSVITYQYLLFHKGLLLIHYFTYLIYTEILHVILFYPVDISEIIVIRDTDFNVLLSISGPFILRSYVRD